MNKKKFFYQIEEMVRERFSPEDNMTIQIAPSLKDNDIVLCGLQIRQGIQEMCPLFYLDGFYEEYRKGKDLKSIADDIVSQYHEGKAFDINLPSFQYEDIKDKIYFKVVGTKENRKNLKKQLHTDMKNGLSLLYFIYSPTKMKNKIGSIRITHELINHCGYDVNQVKEAAKANTPKLFPMVLAVMPGVLCGELPIELKGQCTDLKDMYILSNTINKYGAGALFYPDMQRKLAEYFGKNYYVLPSSLHELILLPDKPSWDAQKIEKNVQDINECIVDKSDFLSDKIYYYDKEKDQLRQAIPDAPEHQKSKADKPRER